MRICSWSIATALCAALAIAALPAVAQFPPSSKRTSQQSTPKSPEEREKALANLYAHLATAEGEESAKTTAEAIERLWLYSGSDTINLLMERAQVAINEKNLQLARKLLDHVVELAPDFAEGWNRRAYLNYMDNNLPRALGDLRRTLALDPNHFKALEGLAQILREIGEKKAALKAFQQLLEVHPYWSGAKQAIEELAREVDGQGI
jgi:tetratricopeptide (TPR) repeat protein